MTPYCDYHIHTIFSVDGRDTIESVCRAAIERGLTRICLTEHVDRVEWEPERAFFRPAEYMAEIERCRALFAGQLSISAGMEAGETHLVADEIAALLNAWPFDFVLGSAHWIDRITLNLSRFYEHQPPHVVEHNYLTRVLELAQSGEFDSLGHLDLIKRYRPLHSGIFDPLPHADVIRAILHAIVQRDKAIEINTSPLRKGLPATCPDLTVLRWYRELGGDKLTVGSDAHSTGEVGADIAAALDLARAAGFGRIAIFWRRQLEWVPL